MKQKKQPFNVLSDVLCKECGKQIKANVVERKQSKPEMCFKCRQRKQNKIGLNPIRTAREVRSNPELASNRKFNKN